MQLSNSVETTVDEEETMLDALFNGSPLAVLISDKQGTVQKYNGNCAELFGYSSSDLVGEKIDVLFPFNLKNESTIYQAYFGGRDLSMEGARTHYLDGCKKDGDTFSLKLSFSYVGNDSDYQVISFISKIFKEDLDVKDLLEEVARIRTTLMKEKELNELKSRFVSMASHEFRTPLGGILTSASLINKYQEMKDCEKVKRHVGTIIKSVGGLTTILDEFLSLDKLEAGKMRTRESEFKLPEVIDEAIEESKGSFGKNRDVLIEYNHCEDLQMWQDRGMLKNVLSNLVSNAIKYSPSGTSIFFECHVEKKNLVVSIRDEGIGIPRKDQDHIFTRFFRGNNVNLIRGTGLGLHIVKKYMNLMDGHISFTSQENKGTTFTITLPLEKK